MHFDLIHWPGFVNVHHVLEMDVVHFLTIVCNVLLCPLEQDWWSYFLYVDYSCGLLELTEKCIYSASIELDLSIFYCNSVVSCFIYFESMQFVVYCLINDRIPNAFFLLSNYIFILKNYFCFKLVSCVIVSLD